MQLATGCGVVVPSQLHAVRQNGSPIPKGRHQPMLYNRRSRGTIQHCPALSSESVRRPATKAWYTPHVPPHTMLQVRPEAGTALGDGSVGCQHPERFQGLGFLCFLIELPDTSNALPQPKSFALGHVRDLFEPYEGTLIEPFSSSLTHSNPPRNPNSSS